MAKMLDGPVPDGARSVSWPWYHHTLTTELTVDARKLLEDYSKVPKADVKTHIYRIRDKAWGIFPWPCIGEFWFLSFGLAKHPLYHTVILPRLQSGESMLDLGACLGQDLRKCIYDGAPPDNLYASDLFPEYEDLAFELWQDRDTFPRGHFFADDVIADNEKFMKGGLMTQIGPGQMDMIAINMFLHLFDYPNQLKVATRILRLLSHRPGSMVMGSQAGVIHPVEEPLKPPFDKTRDGQTRTIFRHSTESFITLWEDAGKAAGVPLRPISCVFSQPHATEASREGVDVGLETEGKKKPFTAEDLFSTHTETRKTFFSGPETGRLLFSIVRR